MPVPTHRHRTPSPPPSPRIIIKKQSTTHIGAPLQRRVLPFHNQLRRRPRDRRQQPLQPTLSPDKLQLPLALSRYQFIVPFRNPQNLVDWRHPRLRKLPPRFYCGEYRSYTLPQPQYLQQHRIHRPGLAPLQRFQSHSALFTHHPRIHQKIHKFRPRKVVRRRHQVGKIQGQSAGNQFWGRSDSFQYGSYSAPLKFLTALPSHTGYTLPAAHSATFPSTAPYLGAAICC
jgi:hypothetical protein